MKKFVSKVFVITICCVVVFPLGLYLIEQYDQLLFETEYVADHREKVDVMDNFRREISLIELIANRQKFEGKKVIVTGVGHIGFESDSLYLSKDDYAYRVGKNAVYLFLRSELEEEQLKKLRRLNGRYVVVEGVFRMETGHEGLFSGSLTDITLYSGRR